MAGIDDVDDLLDQIEGSLQKKSTLTPVNSVKTNNSTKVNSTTTTKTSDASDLLKSLDEIESDSKKSKSHPQKSSTEAPLTAKDYSNETPTLKCRSIFLAGPKEMEYGHCSLMQEKACDNMHCMKCDFQVLLFRGQHWVSSVNYMFFRNFMPDRLNLSKKLSNSPQHTAYCCQCSWTSVSNRKQLSQADSFQWCCNSHKS
ncbi:hypothetical protein BOX15_Mlig005703g1 [Macrostomum lignano]|uniref:Cilia- and flagella-associated protein 418 n=1 Tax=Macrostomum lignano TaxID=282301 RepID=A0A267H736_9PLAT|nr:hypothetical protein BOX15_Mlig005703g1 [Macrostomum lignano]